MSLTIGNNAFSLFDGISNTQLNPELLPRETVPATIGVSSFGDHENINLVVPIGLTDAYKQADWTGFNITEANHLKIKVYLQGAYVSPNEEGEERLMRDDLRAAGLLPDKQSIPRRRIGR